MDDSMDDSGYDEMYEISAFMLSLIGSGSEVSLCVQVAEYLAEIGIAVRVVSMPSVQRFLAQSAEWQEKILGAGPRVSIEAGSTLPWRGIIGSDGLCLGIDTFGASAPIHDLAEHFQFTPDQVAARILSWLEDDD